MNATEILNSLRGAHDGVKGEKQFELGIQAGLEQAIRIVEQVQAAPRGGGVAILNPSLGEVGTVSSGAASFKGHGWVGYVTRRFYRWMGNDRGEEAWVELILFDPDGIEKPAKGGMPARYFHSLEANTVSILKEPPEHDAVIVTEGAYRGWVGYLKTLETEGVTVLLFNPDGDPSEQTLPYDDVFCLSGV